MNWRAWARARRAAFEPDGWRCTNCGQAGRLEAHHVVPLDDGGAAYDLANIRTLCRECHIDKHRREQSPEEAAWRELAVDAVWRV